MSNLSRRRILRTGASALSLTGLSRMGFILNAEADDLISVKMSIALRAMNQTMIWIATEAGLFSKHGLEVTIPRIELAGPETTAALVRDEWQFCHTGLVPVAETALNGGDAVALLRNVDPNTDLYVVTRQEITSLAGLEGKKVGVLSDAYSGQTGVKTRLTIEAAGAHAEYIGLGSYGRIFAALAAGEIDGGAIPVDLKIAGERDHGWHAFETKGFVAPNVFASTRHVVRERRDVAVRAVKGILEAIHLFKTDPPAVLPILQTYLKIDDRKQVEDLHAYFEPLFPRVPRPEFAQAMPALRSVLNKYPTAAKLQESDIADSSIIDEVERSGFIADLYGSGASPDK